MALEIRQLQAEHKVFLLQEERGKTGSHRGGGDSDPYWTTAERDGQTVPAILRKPGRSFA